MTFYLFCNILNVHFVFCNKYNFRSVYTVSNASKEELLPGDMIRYRHPIFTSSIRAATIRDIDPKRKDNPLRLDNMDCLNMYHCVARYKILQPDGTLQEIPEDEQKWRWIKEFKLKKSKEAPYRMSTEGRRVGSLWRGLTDEYMAFAEREGMPQDMMCMPATAPTTATVGDSEEYDSDSGSGDASTELAEPTDQINFHKMVMEKTNDRNAMESRARAGQRKQAEEVNKDRGGGQEVLGKWTVCNIKMPKDRNAFTPNNLPALICGTVYYKNSKKIRYQCCTEHGIIKGTFGREQLDPLPHMDAKGIKVNYAALDKTNRITLTKAGEMYTPVSGRLSYCRCQKNDCSKSKSCNCRKMGKFCTNVCHGGSGKNLLCKNCPPGPLAAPPLP
jgi:hypothetical protein